MITFSLENTFVGRILTSRGFIRPQRDWIIFLILSATLILSALAFDAFLYTQITSGDIYVSVNKDALSLESLQTDQLKKIIANFQNKSTISNTLKIGSQIDPSL